MCSRIQLLTILTFLAIFNLSSSSNCHHNITIDSLATYSFSDSSFCTFQIQKNPSFGFGTFQVFLTFSDLGISTALLPGREGCSESIITEDPLFEQYFPSEKSSVISFVANASDDQCLSFTLVRDFLKKDINYTIQISFTQIDAILQLDQPERHLFAGNKSQTFASFLSNNGTELIQIKINDPLDDSKNDSKAFNLKLIKTNGLCTAASGIVSWLCYLPPSQNILKFSVFNPFESESYEIIISHIVPQQAAYDAFGSTVPFITGFGSLFKVSLPTPGILKVVAKSHKQKYLPIAAAPSLFDLFRTLRHEGIESMSIDGNSLSSLENSVVIRSDQPNGECFYFVRDENMEDFRIASYFIKQDKLRVDSEVEYYIDPEIYEYQHIELKLDTKSFITKYEVTVQASQMSLMNLYYSTDLYSNTSVLFPKDNFNYKKAALEPVRSETLTLPLLVVVHDTSIYLILHGLTKGFYKVSIRQVESSSLQQGILVIILISCISAVIYLFFALIYNLKKSSEFYEEFELPPIPREEISSSNTNQIDLEANLPGIHIVENIRESGHTNHSTHLSPRLIKILRVLKKKVRYQNAKIKQEKAQDSGSDSVSTQEKSEIKEDEACDICYERKKTVLFEPCLHTCSCNYCAIMIIKTSAKCPLCRAQIHQIGFNETKTEELNQENSNKEH